MKHLEAALQAACVKWFDYQFPAHKFALMSIPNEGVRNPINGARMKAMGRRKGAPDMILIARPQKVLFIEFKAPKGRTSPEQKAVHAYIESRGVEVQIIRTFEAFKELITYYFTR